MNAFKNAGHLFRLAGVFFAGLILFLTIRGFLVPKSFGEYGHYRGKALSDIAARPINFTGHQSCEPCHADVLEKKNKGKHAHVNCEPYPASSTAVTPGGGCGLEICASGHPRSGPELQNGRALVGYVNRFAEVHWLRQLCASVSGGKRHSRWIFPNLGGAVPRLRL